MEGDLFRSSCVGASRASRRVNCLNFTIDASSHRAQDYFWSPASEWTRVHWSTALFEKTLPALVRDGMLAGSVYFPWHPHIVVQLLACRQTLAPFFDEPEYLCIDHPALSEFDESTHDEEGRPTSIHNLADDGDKHVLLRGTQAISRLFDGFAGKLVPDTPGLTVSPSAASTASESCSSHDDELGGAGDVNIVETSKAVWELLGKPRDQLEVTKLHYCHANAPVMRTLFVLQAYSSCSRPMLYAAADTSDGRVSRKQVFIFVFSGSLCVCVLREPMSTSNPSGMGFTSPEQGLCVSEQTIILLSSHRSTMS